MLPERWRQIETLFHAALSLKSEERAAYLAEACAADEWLRKEVESLISSYEGGGGLFEEPAFSLGLRLFSVETAGPAVGQFVGPYKVLGLLGKGGMGEVYLADDPALGRNVALKLLPSSFTPDVARVQRFQREARAAAAISHPNVAHIYGTGLADGRHYIAMEYVDGDTLRQKFAGGPLGLREALCISLEVSAALTAAHERSIVHRDVKPENVMIRGDGRVKILDFGIAKTTQGAVRLDSVAEETPGTTLRTDPGTVVGTIRYMSPEQLRSLPVDERTDVWSLGAVLYEMVSGHAPFEGETQNDEIAHILQCEPSALALPSGPLGDQLRHIFERALSKEPERRYQHMEDFARDLKRLLTLVESGNADTTFGVQRVAGSAAPPGGRGHSTTAGRRRAKTGHRSGLTRIFSSADHLVGEIKQHKKGTFGAAVLLALVVTYIMLRPLAPPRPPAQSGMRINPITNAGSAVCAAVSPDGKLLARVEEQEGRETLSVTRAETGDTTPLDTSRDVNYLGLTFSPDGGRLYLVRSEDAPGGRLYRMTLADGVTERLMEGVDSPVSFSPDGGRFAFVRFERKAGEYSLMVANADGTGERILAKRQGGAKFSLDGPAWSPDGRIIACAAGGWGSGHQMRLEGVDVETGREIALGDKVWFSVLQVAWLADQSGLVACSAEQPMAPYQLWRVGYPSGEATRITNDTADYAGVSITRDAGRLITVQSNYVSQVSVAPASDLRRERALTPKVGLSWGLAWTADAKLVLSSMVGSELNISSLDPTTSELKRLTGRGDNYHPSVSADGRYVVFASNRSGAFNIWRMNTEGGEQVQLTFGDGNFYPYCSPDNEWVFYENQSGGKITVWKVPLAGGEAVSVSNEYSRMPVVSPDGRVVAARYFIAEDRLGIALLPAAGGPPLKMLPIPVADWQRVQWTQDGKALTYVKSADGVSNIWRYDLADGQTRRLTDFSAGKIFSYAWSPDFRQLASVRGNVVSDVVMISDFR
ncbi:MAG: serine/threonine-protein kinase [Acidobacteria bacterium]|nr:serine/threonine-protein kinase [Acidobacteriota bacterium]